jgi:hypothetical protein
MAAIIEGKGKEFSLLTGCTMKAYYSSVSYNDKNNRQLSAYGAWAFMLNDCSFDFTFLSFFLPHSFPNYLLLFFLFITFFFTFISSIFSFFPCSFYIPLTYLSSHLSSLVLISLISFLPSFLLLRTFHSVIRNSFHDFYDIGCSSQRCCYTK